MTEFKFTPGPWQFAFGQNPETLEELEVPPSPRNEKGWFFKSIAISKDDDNKIADVYGIQTTGFVQGYDVFEANAKLIVAAPDMLETLIQVGKCLMNAEDRSYERELIQQAIDKATK